MTGRRRLAGLALVPGLTISMMLGATPALAHTSGVSDGPVTAAADDHVGTGSDQALIAQDQRSDAAAAQGKKAAKPPKGSKTLDVVGRGDRALPDGTTDVWEHEGFAYLGTFQSPCGTGLGDDGTPGLVQDLTGPGIPVFDVHNVNKPTYVGTVPSVEGSRINDVKVFTASDGRDILVHSNESCDGGPGGFRVYDVSDPTEATLLAEVQTDDVNPVLRDAGFTDEGVHNLFLFSRDGRDYAAAQVESVFGNFQIFDITDPTAPVLVSEFGAENDEFPGVDFTTTTDEDLIDEAFAYLQQGFGASQNRFLHDFWVAEDGRTAYLANWDAGLIRLDLSTLTAPRVVSVALDPTSEDGEVNSHSVWPSADGTVVVEGEEDFAPFALDFSLNGKLFPAGEANFSTPIVSLPRRTFAGPTVYVGRGCDVDPAMPAAPSADSVAVVVRGLCSFQEKADNAVDAGYGGVLIFNDAARGDAVLTPSGDGVNVPVLFVGHSTGLAVFGAASLAELTLGQTGKPITSTARPDGWSGYRIWDYSDPANPVLASVINTTCSADPLDSSCDPRGIYSAHNVVVDGTTAYFSWYSDGVLVYDVKDPYAPVKIAQYHETGSAFEAANSGIQDVWGIFKAPNSPFVYASDRNGGLYVLKLKGAGAGKNDGGNNGKSKSKG